MGSEYTFYDYLDADGGGSNVIRAWLNSDGKAAKAFFGTMIGLLEASPPPGVTESVWKYPYTRSMTGYWNGFTELRKEVEGVQYRLLCKRQGRSVFLVACGIHKGQNFKADVSATTASYRVRQMMTNPAKYGREHEYD